MSFPNEHAARIRSPRGKIMCSANRFGHGCHGMFCRTGGVTQLQSIRFDKDLHSPADARQWLRENGFRPLLFENSVNPGKRSDADRESLRKGIDPDLFTRSFQVRADTIDEKSRSVEGVIASENPVTVLDLRTFEIIDEILLMSGMRLPDQVPLLDSHQRGSIKNILGSVRNFKIEKTRDGGVLVARNFFDDDEDGLRAFGKVKNGHVRDFSIGYRVHASAEIEAGNTGKVAGREFTAGAQNLRISVDTEVRENSLLAIGADPVAKVRKQGALS